MGYVVEGGTIKPLPKNIQVLQNYLESRISKQIVRFLGFTGYYRKFIKDYALIAKSFSYLTKKAREFIWSDEQRRAFHTLKASLMQKPVLQLFRDDRETELHTDASAEGFAAILLQKSEENNELHPVYYSGQKTIDVRSKYHSYEL